MNAELAKALLAAQKEMPHLSKDAEANTGAFRYKYLSLDSLLEQVLPVLNKHGLVLLQFPCFFNGKPALQTQILHESGESTEAAMPLAIAEDAGAQQQGSSITYARRYSLLSALALAPDEDDDGAAAQKAPAKTPAKSASPATEKPYTRGQLDELNTHLKILQDAFPDHPGEDRTWKDVAQGVVKDRFDKRSVKELTVAEMSELIRWAEDEFNRGVAEQSMEATPIA